MNVIVLILSTCLIFSIVVQSQFLSDSEIQLRVLQEISAYDKQKIPIDKRSLSIYYLPSAFSADDSIDIIKNNLKIFVSAVLSHKRTAKHHAFYIFCIAGGGDNILSQYLPYNATNVAFIKTPIAHNDLFSHMHMVSLLGETIISKFHSILFLNQDVRGPFVDRANGEWWRHFIDIMDENPSVALVGPLISCEMAPHVQTHVFAMRSDAVLEIFSEFNPRSSAGKRNRAKHIETAITAEARALGYDVSSIYYKNQFNKTVFDGSCPTREGNTAQYKSNPTSWCEVQPKETVFMKWGGPPLRIRGYYCQSTVDEIQRETVRIGEAEASLKLSLPETLYGGKLHLLHKEYDKELWLDRSVKKVTFDPKATPLDTSKVCLIVRTSLMQGQEASRNTRLVQMTLDHLIKSLLRQSNSAWEAYFIVTDDQPFDDELRATLSTYGDARLNFLNIDMKYRPKYSVREAGYIATDQALRLIQNNAQCKWISVTNGDNIYGSQVFHNILATAPLRDTQQLPDVVLSPLDSRNYADQDYTRKRIAMDRHDSWELRCGFLEGELMRTPYGYAMTPFPNLGGLDLAGLFMDRKKFVATGVYFSDFTDPKKYVCPGCQDGYFISELLAKHKWTLHRAPIVKFNSLIFHGPSPLWCIAGGNVWYDHPGKTVCLNHKTVGHMYPDPRFDWESFYQLHGLRVCLRMSEKGFNNMSHAIIT